MDRTADHLRDAREPQISADGRDWHNAEQQNHDWRHERAAADAGESHQQTDEEAGQRVS
jgi:hypothetical protein